MTSGASRRWIMQAVEDSLRRLDTDYIDLYQVHRPDPNTPEEETLRALDDLVTSGKVRYLGNSNFSGWQIAHSHWIAETRGYAPFISAQNEYSLLNRRAEAEVMPAAEKFGLGILPFLPLASGMLTGKYKRNADAPEGTVLGASPEPEPPPEAEEVVEEPAPAVARAARSAPSSARAPRSAPPRTAPRPAPKTTPTTTAEGLPPGLPQTRSGR